MKRQNVLAGALLVLAACTVAVAEPDRQTPIRSLVLQLLDDLTITSGGVYTPPGGGWTDNGTTVTTTASTDGVGVGSTPAATEILDVTGDATRTDVSLHAHSAGTIFLGAGASELTLTTGDFELVANSTTVLQGTSAGIDAPVSLKVGSGAVAATEILDVTGDATRHTIALTPGTGGKLTVGGQQDFVTGLGSVPQIIGPSDQSLRLDGGTGRSVVLNGATGSNGVELRVNNSGKMIVNASAVVPQVPVQGQAGTAAAPTYSTAGDPDTGFFSLGANQLAVTTGGLTRNVTGGQITLTDGAATTIATIALSAGQRAGGVLTYSIEVTDATDFQVLTGVVSFAAVDKAGTLTAEAIEALTTTTANAESSISTLTNTWTVSDGTNAFSIQVNANSSLVSPTIVIRFELDLFGNAATVTIP